MRYEWVRITTVRSTYWITAVAMVIGVGLSFLISMGSSFEARDGELESLVVAYLAPAVITQFAAVAGPYLVAYILVIIGVLAWGHEYRHGMVRATLTAHGSRTRVWVAKFVVLGLWVGGVVLTILLLSTFVGWLWLRDDGVVFGGQVAWEQVARTFAYTVIFVWVGAAVASILRNQTASLVVVYIWPLVVEALLGLILRLIPGMDFLDDISKGFPFNAGDRIIRSTEIGRAFDEALGGAQLSTGEGFAVFGGFCAALMATSYILFSRRDA